MKLKSDGIEDGPAKNWDSRKMLKNNKFKGWELSATKLPQHSVRWHQNKSVNRNY